MRNHLLTTVFAVAFAAPIFGQAPLPVANRVAVPTPILSSSGAVDPVNYYVTPGLTVGQYGYNLNTIGKGYASLPPYAIGYNPYPPTIVYPNTPFVSSPVQGWAAFRPYTGYNVNFYPGYTVLPQGYYYPTYPY